MKTKENKKKAVKKAKKNTERSRKPIDPKIKQYGIYKLGC